MTDVNQIPRRNFPNLDAAFNQHYSQVVDSVNVLLGYYGEINLKNHLNLGGNKITNVGAPTSSKDAVTVEHADKNYSAPAIRQQLEANGSYPMQSVRRMNDSTQREQNSSWLNSLYSTAPSANNVQVLFSTPGSGSTHITVPAGQFQLADGETVFFNAFTQTVSNPVTLNIASISSDGTLATVTTTTPLTTGIVPQGFVTIAGVVNNSFNGLWQVAAVTGSNTFTYNVGFGPTTSSGGTVGTAGVWYIYIVLGDPNPHSIGVPVSADMPFNGLPPATEQRQAIAAATLNRYGGGSAQSAG